MNVIRLATSQPTKPVRACNTCQHYRRMSGDLYNRCLATSTYANHAREDECNYGQLWEPKPQSFFKQLNDLILNKLKGR
jgi:hypothetical protein